MLVMFKSWKGVNLGDALTVVNHVMQIQALMCLLSELSKKTPVNSLEQEASAGCLKGEDKWQRYWQSFPS